MNGPRAPSHAHRALSRESGDEAEHDCSFPHHQLGETLVMLLLGNASLMGETRRLTGDMFNLIVEGQSNSL